MYWKVSAFLKCVLTSRIDFSWNLVPLYIIVSKNTISVSDISAVNLIVGRCKFASSMKVSMCLGGEAFRILRTNSSETTFEDNISNFKKRFVDRGYPGTTTLQNFIPVDLFYTE